MFRPSLSIFAHLLLVSKISLGSRSALHEIVIGNRTATGTFQLIFLNFQKYWLKLLIDYLPIFNTIFKILKSLKIFKALSFSWKHFHRNMSISSDEIVIKHCLKWILSLYSDDHTKTWKGFQNFCGNALCNSTAVGSQCGNFLIFLSLRFYVKSIFGIIEMQNLPFIFNTFRDNEF